MSGRWLAVWLRGVRSEPGRSLAVAVLILVTVLIASSVPRLLARASDDALHGEFGDAPSTVRNLDLTQFGRISPAAGGPLDPVVAAGTTLEAQYPAPIPAVIAGQGLVVDTPLWHPTAGTTLDAVVNLRIQQDVESHIKLVAGRLPTGETSTIPDPTPGASPGNVVTVFEVAASSQTADKLGLAIGGQLILQPEPSDPLAANRGTRLAVVLVGTYDVVDPTDGFWMNDQSVDHTYTYALQEFVEYVGATMLLAPDAYPPLMAATNGSRLPMIYQFRSYVADAALKSDELDTLAASLRRALTLFPPATPTLSNGGAFGGPDQMSPASLQTGLLGLIRAHQARWASGATILTILWTGAGLVILASLALVAETIARRRRVALSLVGRRGASARQLGAAVLTESVLLVLPAALIGTIAASLLVPVSDQGPTLLVAVIVAAGAVAFIALASRRNRGQDAGDRPRRLQRLGSGRLVAEALVVSLAVVGAVLLRGRSTTGSSSLAPVPAGAQGATSTPGPDPFLAVAPALVGLAAGIIAVRLLPVVLGILARLIARRRGLVAVLGVRRAARDGSVAAVLVVAMTATTVGAFASVLLDQINAGASSASWQTVGADFQLTGSSTYLASFQASPPPGVGATAAVSTVSVSVSTGGSRTLVAVDPAAVDSVADGTPAQPDFPAEMLGPVAGGPLPAIVSADADGTAPIVAGQEFSVRIGGAAVQLKAVEVRDAFPTVPAGQPFVIVASPQLTFVPVETAVLASSSSLSQAELQSSVSDLLGVTVIGQAATETSLRDAPAVTAVSLGVLSAAAAVLLYGLLTIILAIALDTAGRRRETARLQILGLSNRQTVLLAMVEFSPVVLAGVLGGLGVGLALIAFVGPGLGLPAVLGVAALAPAGADIGRLIGVVSLTLALILAATLLSTVFERQTQLATAVRD